MRIGFDLDNTVICYDEAFFSAAISRGHLQAASILLTKEEVKNTLIAAHDGGMRDWQALQGYVYGPGLSTARLFAGVLTCLDALTDGGHELFIVSHKTQYGHFDETKTDLRDAARAFLRTQGVLEYIADERLNFCSTLSEKIAKITELRCDVFVDDLTDVLFHTEFPPATRRVLFRGPQTQMCDLVQSWDELRHVVARPAHA
jgi:hypothetical protein